MNSLTVKKPILIVIYSGPKFGGAEKRFSRLASHLIEMGENLQLLCTSDALKAINDIGINFPEFNSNGERSICLIDKKSSGNILIDKLNRLIGIFRLILKLKKSSAHIHLAMNPGLISTIISFTKLDYSISVVDYTLDFNYWFFKRSVTKARAVDCLSDSIREQLIAKSEKFLLPDVFVSPCSFTDNRYVAKVSDYSLKSERDIDVALIARAVPGKGHDLFRSALSYLPEINYYVEPTNEPFEIMRRSKIFLSLQDKENYPSQALLEAMISGCAIIATDVGETRKLLDDSCAILIPSDAAILAESIVHLLRNVSQRHRMAETAKRRVLSEQTIERFSDYFVDFCGR